MSQPLPQPASGSTTSVYEQIALGRQIILQEAQTLSRIAGQMPADFPRAVELLGECQGAALVTGIGKAGWIGQKLSATLASTGTRSHFVHPGEAMHGDLGRFGPNDVLIVLSNSGETEEILRMLPSLREWGTPVIAITADDQNTLARQATYVLDYGKTREACPNGLAPSATTTAMLALGDALALVTSQRRGFGPTDFATFHPGGSLGRQLALVEDVMRPITLCRVSSDRMTVRETYIDTAGPSRRSGAILLVDEQGSLSGIFTDSDLARLLETRHEDALDQPMVEVMSSQPTTVLEGARMSEAVELLAAKNLSELPVINEQSKPVGMVDITDLIGYLPKGHDLIGR
jgi:arabinose-5-phosphate isomerase